MEKYSVLVVDHDEIAQSLICKVLTMGGYSSCVADSTSSALQHLQSGQWFGVILELGIPGVGGLELLQIIRKRYPDLPVIVVTDEHKVEAAITAMKYGAANYLIKPVMPRDILNSIQDVKKSMLYLHRPLADTGKTSPKKWKITEEVLFHEESRRIVFREKTVLLTGLESNVLKLLVSAEPSVVPTNQIVALSQGYDLTSTEAAQIIRPTISRLNKKLAAISEGKIKIANVRGAGYYLEKS